MASNPSTQSSRPTVSVTTLHVAPVNLCVGFGALAALLDDRYGIPGTNVRFGLDAVVGLLPGIGDLAGAALSGYIVLEGRRLGVPKRVLLNMMKNIAVDAALGTVPIVGDLADIQWKANRKNVHLLIEHFDGQGRSRSSDTILA